MQIRVDKLRKNLALLQPVVPRKPSLEILTHVRLMEGQMVATDLETTVSIALPKSQDEAFLLPFKSVLELLKYVPGDEVLTIQSINKTINLSWNGGTATYEVPDIQDYPDIALQEPQATGLLNGDMLISGLVAALPYCATDGSRPVLVGVTLYLGAVLQIAAADGFRMSFQSLNLTYPVQQTVVIPANTVSVLEYLWRHEPAQVGLETTLIRQLTQSRQLQLSIGNGNIGVRFGNITLISKLIEGTPPDHLALLNNFQEPTKVKLMASEFYIAVRRLERIAREGTGIVRLQWTGNHMTISSRSEEKGEVQAEVSIDAENNPGRIALNLKYLLDYLAGKDGLVTIGITNPSSPAIFHYGAKPIVAIIPMNVQWGDEQPATDHPETKPSQNSPNPSEQNPEPTIEEETHVDAAERPDDNSKDMEADLKVTPDVAPTNNAQPETKKPRRETRKKKK